MSASCIDKKINVNVQKKAGYQYNALTRPLFFFQHLHDPWTTDAQWSIFSLKSQTFGLGQTNWADKFWGIWGIFGYISALILVLWVPCPCFSLFNHYFYKKLSQLFIWNWDLNLGRKELRIYISFVRCPWHGLTTYHTSVKDYWKEVLS
jgi:hypothetical protein